MESIRGVFNRVGNYLSSIKKSPTKKQKIIDYIGQNNIHHPYIAKNTSLEPKKVTSSPSEEQPSFLRKIFNFLNKEKVYGKTSYEFNSSEEPTSPPISKNEQFTLPDDPKISPKEVPLSRSWDSSGLSVSERVEIALQEQKQRLNPNSTSNSQSIAILISNLHNPKSLEALKEKPVKDILAYLNTHPISEEAESAVFDMLRKLPAQELTSLLHPSFKPDLSRIIQDAYKQTPEGKKAAAKGQQELDNTQI